MGSYGVKLEKSVPLRLGPHPDRPVTESWREWVSREIRPLAVDLFSGGGGLSLGVEKAGFRVAVAVDNDPLSVETHQHNFPGLALEMDLGDDERIETLVSLLDGLDIALVAGGPPCQPFSRAGRSKIRSLVELGRRSSHDARRELWRTFLHVVEEVRPRAALMENVPDMALADEFGVVRWITSQLERLDYDVDFALVDAWRHGVPQHRQRLILVAMRDGRPFIWPSAQQPVTLGDAISDLPLLGDGTGGREMPYPGPMTAFQRRARAGMTSRPAMVWDHVTRPVRDDDRRAFELMDSSTKYTDLPEELRRYRSDIFDDKYKRLAMEELSRSITAHIARDGYWYIHPIEARTLTVREAARIQTFPDDYRFAGTRSDAFRQIGNAVPPALAEAVGSSILAAVREPVLSRRNHRRHRWADGRRQLKEWGERDRASQPWRYPADPWVVLVGALLTPRSGINRPDPGEFLERFPRPEAVSPEELDQVAAAASTASQRRAVQRLGAAAGVLTAGADAWTGRGWARAARLGPAEEAWVRCVGLGEDRLIVSAATLRVAARLTGSAVDRQRELSNGRVVLAQVIGADDDSVPLLNASLTAMGNKVCTPVEPHCGACPLRKCCTAGAASRS